ncbi:MAG: dockerin type I domain-containing protein [Lachnospiraceae bacterium]|jgi:beta-N-acetylglucosaminidase
MKIRSFIAHRTRRTLAAFLAGVVLAVFAAAGAAEIKTESIKADDAFEQSLDAEGFPEDYKELLREIHEEYPLWTFKADHLGISWDTATANEEESADGYRKNLVYKTAISSWKSSSTRAFNYATGEWYGLDGSSWVQASDEIVEYFMDPRNYLDSTHIFAFQKLSYSGTETLEGISNIISGTFMENSSHDLTYEGNSYTYPTALMYAGEVSGVSPYHLAARIRQELGVNGSDSISGTLSGYEGYYNYYNWGASTTSDHTAIENGLLYAMTTNETYLLPWNTRMRSIVGGAIRLGKNYISVGQDTIYYEKFDLDGYWHQYMQNIQAPYSEAVSASKAYSEEIKQNTALEFVIPIYDDMPSTACPMPTGDGNPANCLTDIRVDGYTLTPTFSMYTNEYSLIVPYETDSVTIEADKAISTETVEGTGTVSLNTGVNTVYINVTAENGSTNTYTLTITRRSSSSGDQGGGNSDSTDSGTSQSWVRGDANGDGKVGAVDILVIKRSMLGYTELSETQSLSADANNDGKVSILDILKIKRHILGYETISQ